jgi:hypothetical protein
LDEGSLDGESALPAIRLMGKIVKGVKVTKEYQPGVITETIEECGNITAKVSRQANDMDLI